MFSIVLGTSLIDSQRRCTTCCRFNLLFSAEFINSNPLLVAVIKDAVKGRGSMWTMFDGNSQVEIDSWTKEKDKADAKKARDVAAKEAKARATAKAKATAKAQTKAYGNEDGCWQKIPDMAAFHRLLRQNAKADVARSTRGRFVKLSR